jgi:hypothetical protein
MITLKILIKNTQVNFFTIFIVELILLNISNLLLLIIYLI